MATFWLEYEQNGNLQKFPFDAQSISIGRDKSSDFVLDHPTISRQHAIITHDGRGNFRLVALSRGGLTAIERVPVQGETELYDGAVLHIGQLWFRFRSDYAMKRAPSQAPNPGNYGGMGGTPGHGAGGFGGMGGTPGHGAGGFGGMGGTPGHGAGGFGGMGGTPGHGAGGFGGMGGTPGHGAGGFGGMGDSPGQGMSGFGSFGSMGDNPGQGMGSFGSSPGQGNEPAKPGNDAGIVSWDEIAQSREATQDDDYVPEASDYDRISAAGTEKEKSNPLVVVVGIVLALGMLGWVFLGDETKSRTGDGASFNMADLPVVEIKVSCIGEVDCMRQARAVYARGIDLIEKQDVENRNLFTGYMRMLETRALLAEAGFNGIPEDMKALETTENAARQALDRKFREFKVQFHQSQQKKDSHEMVRVLNSVIVFFPERTAREHRWAANMETEMKRNGTYPRSQ